MEITDSQETPPPETDPGVACITIDTRESACITYFEKSGVSYTVCPLPVADFTVTRGNTHILIERKTVADLISSIKDSRYAEQKTRLIHERETSGAKIIYIIEGTSVNDLAESAILSMIIRDNIHVIRTENVIDTCACVISIHKKLNTKSFFSTIGGDGVHVFSEKAARKTNITPETCYLSMLVQIPGVSMKTAIGISLVYPCMAELLTASVSVLGGILINNRKLGVKRSTVILNYIMCNASK